MRIFWRWNSQPELHHTDIETSQTCTSEGEIREAIGASLGSPGLGQYIAIDYSRIERTPRSATSPPTSAHHSTTPAA